MKFTITGKTLVLVLALVAIFVHAEGVQPTVPPISCSDFPCGEGDNKVLLCHVPPGNPGNEQTICISQKAVPAHLANHEGDHCGPCDLDP